MAKQIKITFYAKVSNKNYDLVKSDLMDRADKVIREEFPELKQVSVFRIEDFTRTKNIVRYGTINLENIVRYGTINLGNKVRVTDPGYAPDVWCVYTINDMLPGEYITYAIIVDTGMLGRRVSKLKIVHRDYIDKELEFEDVCGNIGVDSGNCGFFDYDRFKEANDAAAKTYGNEIDPFTAKWWSISDDDDLGGTYEDWGVLSHSGYGDGCYVLSVAHNDSHKAVSAIIDYGI